MNEVFKAESIRLINGDCLEVLRSMESNSIDSCVTDPPYGLSFMGKKWDYDIPSKEIWEEVLRVLKPGGHLLSFGGSRTYHRMACAVEDAGFEIRDCIMWIYGSGFPKSLDVSKAIDKTAGAEREKVHATGGLHANANLNDDGWSKIGTADPLMDGPTPVTEAARQWQGWGTALKPAHEPIIVARKPLEGTVAFNVQKYGTGALNIDGCRVDTCGESFSVPQSNPSKRVGVVGSDIGISSSSVDKFQQAQRDSIERTAAMGRFPANVIHDGSDEVLAAFPIASGQQGDLSEQDHAVPQGNAFGQYGPKKAHKKRSEENKSAARFFYCPKASKKDRGTGNNHPTVKPTELMKYLCRLITPPNGIVLDPFMGSGTTGVASVDEGFGFCGIERNIEYVEIAVSRIKQNGLFQ